MKLYHSLGCQLCHSVTATASGVAPKWKGLAGSKVTLGNGQTVTADDAYLLNSIEDPTARSSPGIRGVG